MIVRDSPDSPPQESEKQALLAHRMEASVVVKLLHPLAAAPTPALLLGLLLMNSVQPLLSLPLQTTSLRCVSLHLSPRQRCR